MNANLTHPWVRKPSKSNYRAEQKAACGGSNETSRESCKEGGVVFRWQNQNIYDTELAASMQSGYDIIIANMGLGNIVHHSTQWAGRLMQHAQQLAAQVAGLPSSTRFYWRTTTPICEHGRCRPNSNFQGCGVPREANSMIDISNVVIPTMLLQRDHRVQLLDVRSLTHCNFYEDHVHHPLLTVDHILLLLSKECPQLAPAIGLTCPHLCSALQRQRELAH